jgi:hypothetical protein
MYGDNNLATPTAIDTTYFESKRTTDPLPMSNISSPDSIQSCHCYAATPAAAPATFQKSTSTYTYTSIKDTYHDRGICNSKTKASGHIFDVGRDSPQSMNSRCTSFFESYRRTRAAMDTPTESVAARRIFDKTINAKD